MRRITSEERKIMDSAKKAACELCGSARGCEVHHIIPAVVGGSTSPDNLITVCAACHAKLTPRRELSRIGIKRAKAKNLPLVFYQLCEQTLDKQEWLDAENVMDIFDIVMKYAQAIEDGTDKEMMR